ncbi:MAG: carbohydrate kinase family protein, partial [Gemmatimonadales bacterium]
ANAFLRSLTKRSASTRFIEVPESNNRVTLRYHSDTRRSERLWGGVPGWSWQELGALVIDLDVIYVNFISGFEMDLATATALRTGFDGPIYVDFHSLMLGLDPDGDRRPRPLSNLAHWLGCFDCIQVNDVEMSLMGSNPMEVAATAFAHGVRLVVVTMGERGAAYFTQRPLDLFNHQRSAGPIETALIPTEQVDRGDPTGCGDVFGAGLVAQLVRPVDLETAIRTANALAGRNLQSRGATNLHYALKGEIAPN